MPEQDQQAKKAEQPKGDAPKLSGARSRAATDGDDKFTSSDTFENPSVKLLQETQVTEDANGINRIAGGYASGFVPAPMEATDKQKEEASKREELFAGVGTKSRGDEIKDKDRAKNVQGDGGSQSTPAA